MNRTEDLLSDAPEIGYQNGHVVPVPCAFSPFESIGWLSEQIRRKAEYQEANAQIGSGYLGIYSDCPYLMIPDSYDRIKGNHAGYREAPRLVGGSGY